MASIRSKRVPMEEQIRLINECRRSGLSDAEWCRQHNIPVSTFYNWLSRCRKKASESIPPATYGHSDHPRSKQDVVSVDIVPDVLPELSAAASSLTSHPDDSHTIEIEMNGIRIRISNSADPVLLSRTIRFLKAAVSCQEIFQRWIKYTSCAAILI